MLIGMLVLCTTAIFSQTTIKGRITDSKDGNPIVGATIKVRGERTVTLSGTDGSFEITPKSGKVLEISEIGHSSQSITYTGSGALDIKLEPDLKALSEVVVTGIGVATSKKKIAIAVESIGADKLPQAPTADIGSALVGKIAGAQISSTNGSPGQPVNILLRGINTINAGTRPMILVDGVEVKATGLESLDLSNIDRVEVVQGPAAASIYGAFGSNGVIQLFSKKGKQGKVTVNISSSVAVNSLLNIGNVNKSKFHSFSTNANGEVIDGTGAVLAFDEETGSYLTNPVFNLITATSVADKAYDKNLVWYDHYKMFYKTANTYNNSVNISGATEKFDFSLVASDSRQETVFKNNGDYSRTNISANLGAELFKGLKLRSVTQIVSTQSTLLDPTGRNMLFAINNSRPFANYEQRDAAGLYAPYYGDAVGVNAYNFNYIVENAKAKDLTVDVIQSFNLNYKINKFVDLDAKYGLNRSAYNSKFQIAEQSASLGADYWEYWAEFYSPRTSYGAPTKSSESGEINNRDHIDLFQNLNAQATFKLDLEKDLHTRIPLQSTTLVGWDYRKRKITDFITSATDAPSYTPYNSTDFANFRTQRDYLEEQASYGYLVQQRFDYGNIGGIAGGFRTDYSSSFGRGSKPFTFGNANAYLRVSQFNFWQNNNIGNIITEWKLRAAYGAAGNQPTAYARFPILTTTSLGAQSSFSTPVSNANPDLQLEVTKELEIGTDLTLKTSKSNWLSNVNLSFTYWKRKAENVIDRVDVAPSIGIGRQLTNAMNLESNGIQASLNLAMFTSRNFTWNFLTNFSKQKSIVKSILGGAEIIKQSAAGSSQYVIKEGEQIGQLYGYVFINSVDALDPSGNPYISKTDQVNYVVASNGYVVNKTTKQPFASAGRYALGDPNPKFNMSFINEIAYKSFITLAFQWDWVYKSNLYNQTKEWMYRDGIHQDYATPITIDGQTAAYTAFYRGAYAFRQANGTKSYFMEDASFLRLRNVALSFDLARAFTIKGISRLQLVLTGRNLITITNYTGFDPEVSSGTVNSAWDRGVDHNTIPNLKTYQVGLNLSF